MSSISIHNNLKQLSFKLGSQIPLNHKFVICDPLNVVGRILIRIWLFD